MLTLLNLVIILTELKKNKAVTPTVMQFFMNSSHESFETVLGQTITYCRGHKGSFNIFLNF